MPALNFKRDFADQIKNGEKTQTIRKSRKDTKPHCRVGDQLKLYTGQRTKHCELLGVGKVTSIKSVSIYPTYMELDGVELQKTIAFRDDPLTDNEFAEKDGFAGFMEMADFFEQTYGLPFHGVVISWEQSYV